MLATTIKSAYNPFAAPPQPQSTPLPLSPRSPNVHGPAPDFPLRRRRSHILSPHRSGCVFEMTTPPLVAPHDKENTTHDTFGTIPTTTTTGTTAPTTTIFAPPSLPPQQHRVRANVKQAPIPKAAELRERRRTAYLDKVREKRDEGRFDDMMRLDFLRQKRTWEAELAASAAPWDGVEEEDWMEGGMEGTDGMELPGWRSSGMMMAGTQEEVEVENVARKEQEELEALLENMSSAEVDGIYREEDEHLYSDGGEYEQLFEELVAQEAQMGGEEMDMT